MDNKTNKAYLILISAIIWAGVILMCAFKLSGTEAYKSISNVLIFGVVAHLILVWIPTGIFKKK